ncbi:MAG: type II toxin-antitoxin system prevent-host-death family antitoxin [Pseudonocardiales bacterium]|nr:type II toxin-antitoxin system prevent-host-death family antitoxin [Pseudonocardiales bacterium]
MDIGIRELRDGLSRHLATVQEGHTLVVTDHGRPIAHIVPIQQQSTLDQLIAEGVVRPPASPRRSAPRPVEATGSVSGLVGEQRR